MSSPSVATFARHRWQGTFDIDPWGLDPELVSLVAPAAAWRWRIELRGADHLPPTGPAVLVFNRRFGLSEPAVLVAAIRRETGRHVRIADGPDVAPAGPLLRRLGAVLALPDEVAGLIRAGELVGLPAERSPVRPRRAGAAPLALVEPAGAHGVPVIPVAVRGREAGRTWRVTVGAPVPLDGGDGPLAAASVADLVRRGLQDLLD